MTQISICVIVFIYTVNIIAGQELSALLSPMISSACMELGICETVDNYPTQLARKLIQELKDRNTIIADDPVFDPNQRPGLSSPDIYFRSGTFDGPNLTPRRYDSSEDNSIEEKNEVRLCESTIQYEHPKIAENKNNEWKFILNDEEVPVQTFRAERCKPKRSQCSKEMSFIPNYEGVCVQRWTLKEMYYINEEGNSATDYFKVPTCCSCRLLHINK